MSHFHRALRVLKQTKHPLFLHMAATERAVPLALGIHQALMQSVPLGERQPIHSALWRLTKKSRRYLEALCAEGAMRHDLDGNIVEPVSDHHRQVARAALDAPRGAPAPAAGALPVEAH